MKQLFENWRKHLREQEEEPTISQKEEKFFGSDIRTIAMDLLDKVREYEQAYNYIGSSGRLAAEEVSNQFGKDIKFLGSGSWRAAFSVDNFVIKLNYQDSDSGREMNQDDINLGRMGEFSTLFPKVYMSDPNNDWIVMEKATPITNWNQIMQYFPNKILGDYSTTKSQFSYYSLFMVCLDYKVLEMKGADVSLRRLNMEYEKDDYSDLFREKNPNFTKVPPLKVVVSNFEYPLFLLLVKLIVEFNVAIYEIRPGNTGIGEDGRFLLIDSSIQSRINNASIR
jgi:hypothetical protein